MCGISGLIRRGGRVDRTPVTRMHDALRHRGPDGEGEYIDDHVSLMHRRLSIIDLEGGRQPLFNEDGSLVLIANGEIYNFVELRRELEGRGHRFSTGSDCEVILHLYEDFGDACVEHLRGMFAFALWDVRQRRLLLARDRMGEKPLYLYQTDEFLIFASELRGLLSSGMVPIQLDADAIDMYFHYDYVPEPRTPIRDVWKLDASCLLTVDVASWRFEPRTYWRMEESPPLEGDPAELIRAELERIAEIVIRSEVPVGVALSGGLDSSLIAALAARNYSGTLHAFTVGYPGRPPYDERADAKALANHLKIPLHEIELSADQVIDNFEPLVSARDDLLANISSPCYHAIMEQSRACGVPVLLLGQGGDELFWGYDWVRRSVQMTEQKEAQGRPPWCSLLGYLSPLRNGVAPRKLASLRRVGRAMRAGWRRFKSDRLSPAEQMVFYDLLPGFQQAETALSKLYTGGFRQTLSQRPHDVFTTPRPWPRVDLRMTELICRTYLRQDGVAHADRLSMSRSVELRLPLLDHRLVETVMGLRKTRRDDREPAKAWLRAAIKDLLPAWVIDRKKKGFQPPALQWYAQLFQQYRHILHDGFLVQTGILTDRGAKRLSQGECPPGVVHPLSFRALVLEIWCRNISALQGARVSQLAA